MLRARLELACSALFVLLTLLTVVWPTWIEGLTGLEPDAGSGEIEWLVATAFGVLAVGLGLLGMRDYRRARSRPQPATAGPGPTNTSGTR